MDRKRMILIMIFAVLCVAVRYLARYLTQTARSGALLSLLLISLLAAALAAVCARMTPKYSAYCDVFSPQRADTIFSVISVLFLLVGGVQQIMEGTAAALALGVLCVVSALGLAFGANYRRRGKNPPARCYVPAIVFYAGKLFRDFRQWMVDPAILDYCFLLFALICFMLATYHMGAFSFDRGSSRSLTFYALLGLYFGVIAPTPTGWNAELFVYGGSALWMLVCVYQLALQKPRRQAPAHGPDAPAERQ